MYDHPTCAPSWVADRLRAGPSARAAAHPGAIPQDRRAVHRSRRRHRRSTHPARLRDDDIDVGFALVLGAAPALASQTAGNGAGATINRAALFAFDSAAAALRALTAHGVDQLAILRRIGMHFAALFTTDRRRRHRRAAGILHERTTAQFTRASAALHPADVFGALALLVGGLHI